jgi:hypothetical protein
MDGLDAMGDLRFGTTIASDEDLRETLRRVVTEAVANGVDVRGSWPVSGGDAGQAWDLEITEVAPRHTADVRDVESLLSSIVEAVATREGVSKGDLPSLLATVDYDTLDGLIDLTDTDSPQEVRFQYYGYSIAVRSDGSLTLDG